MKKDRNLHHFDKRVAKKFTVNAAIVLNNIDFWIKANKEQNKREVFKNGRWWTYSTISDYSKVMDYMSQKQIEKSLNDLKQSGLLIKDCFNQNSYDRTAWYTIDYALFEEMFDKKVDIDFLSRGNGNPPQGKSSINKNIEEDVKENTNTVALSSKISSNSNEENQTTVKEKEINPPPKIATSPPLNKEKESNKVKQTEAVSQSTNEANPNTLYTSTIKLIVERFNELSNKSLNYETKEYQKLISKCLKEFSKKELQDGSAAEKVGEMMVMKLKHTEPNSPIFFQKQYFRISTLFAKANFDKYLLELEEMQEERVVKTVKKEVDNSKLAKVSFR